MEALYKAPDNLFCIRLLLLIKDYLCKTALCLVVIPSNP